MELLFLDKNFDVAKIIDTFMNFSWTRKYYDVGNFTIEIGLDDFLELKKNECKYIYCKDFRETAVIESYKNNFDIQNINITLSGNFLEKKLEDRIVPVTNTYSGTTEEIARKIVEDFCINCDNPLLDGKLKLGKLKGLGTKIRYQNTGNDIKTILYDLLKNDELSFNIDYDYIENLFYFNVWKGLDRTDNQTENSWVVFSENFENIKKENYSYDESKFKNYVYVAGEGKAQNRVVVEIDKVQEGEDRQELYVDARDLQQDDKMTDNEYKEILQQRGLEKLEEYNKVEIAEFDIDTNSNLIYKKDFDLGDLAMYKNDKLDINIDNRIVEISHVFNGSEENIEVIFGEDYYLKGVI